MYFTITKSGRISSPQKYEKICNIPILSATKPMIIPLYHFSKMAPDRTMMPPEINIKGLNVVNSNRMIHGNRNRPNVWLTSVELVV